MVKSKKVIFINVLIFIIGNKFWDIYAFKMSSKLSLNVYKSINASKKKTLPLLIDFLKRYHSSFLIIGNFLNKMIK